MIEPFRKLLILTWLIPGLVCISGISAHADEVRSLRTVVIDPGHGGHDPGAVAGGVREKDIVLDLALRLGKKINGAYPDVKVIYTRSKDVFIPLFERADIANRNKADLFISLHANYVSSPSASGTETFTLGLHRSQENLEVAKKENSVILLEEDYSANYEGFDPREAESYIMFENMQSEYQGQSIDFAAQIQQYFGRNLKLIDRGVKQAGFLVLRRASMPSVLVEVGFISNPDERKFLVSEAGKEKVAESVFQAFSNYKKSIDDKSRFTMAQSGGHTTAAGASSGTGNSTGSVAVPAVRDTAPPSGTRETPPAGLSSGNNQAKPSGTPAAAATGSSATTAATTSRNSGSTAAQSQGTWFGVQVSAAGRAIETTPANFKSEKNVTRFQVGNLYKYVIGRFNTFEEARKERDRLKSKFPDAFIVVVDKGVPTAAKK